MNNVKQALTRKFGPLPAWAWAGIAAVGIWWYRKRSGSGSSAQQSASSGSGLASVGPYGQDYYPIDGGGYSGGGYSGGGSFDTSSGAGTAPTATGDSGAPTINVPPPPGTPYNTTALPIPPSGKPPRNRNRKPKAQHVRKGISGKGHIRAAKGRIRSAAATHPGGRNRKPATAQMKQTAHEKKVAARANRPAHHPKPKPRPKRKRK